MGRAEISENVGNLLIADRGSVHGSCQSRLLPVPAPASPGSCQSRIHLRVQELERAHAIASYGAQEAAGIDAFGMGAGRDTVADGVVIGQ